MGLTSLGLMLFVAGILMLGVGLYYYMYIEGAWSWLGGPVSYPYQTQGTFGIIAGFVLLAAGMIHMAKEPTVSYTAKKPTSGFLISLIAGILTYLFGMLFWSSDWIRPVWLPGADPATLGAIEAICGIIIILGAILISMPGKEPIGSIIVIMFSVIGFISLGATFMFNAIGIIGGIEGLVKK